MASRRAGTGLLYRFYERRLSREIARAAVPRHIAMIIDGNRRWARLNALATVGHGHRAGAAKMQEFLGWCDGFGVEVVTLYLLSNDNVANRDAEEVEELCAIIADLADALSTGTGWRIRHVGHSGALPPALAESLAGAAERSRSESGMQVNLAVGYGGRHEVVEAIRRILESHEGPTADLAERLSPELIGEHLYTTGQPDPDLVIRTSGEQRLSDFMLWQSAHSEFYFMEALGPDMREVDFLRALRDYGTRSRRFGR